MLPMGISRMRAEPGASTAPAAPAPTPGAIRAPIMPAASWPTPAAIAAPTSRTAPRQMPVAIEVRTAPAVSLPTQAAAAAAILRMAPRPMQAGLGARCRVRLTCPERQRIAFEQAVEHMILPRAVDAQIGARETFAAEACAFEQPDRCLVPRQARRFDAMQAQRCKSKADPGTHRLRHIATPGIRRPHPIAERRRLGDATPDLADGQPAEQHVIVFAEQKQGIGLILLHRLGMTADAAAEARTGEIVGRPGRLPRHEEDAAALTQQRPRGVIAHFGRAQIKSVAAYEGGVFESRAEAEDGHRYFYIGPSRAATWIGDGAFETGPMAATVGAARRSRRPATRTSSMVSASIRSMISLRGMTRPNTAS